MIVDGGIVDLTIVAPHAEDGVMDKNIVGSWRRAGRRLVRELADGPERLNEITRSQRLIMYPLIRGAVLIGRSKLVTYPYVFAVSVAKKIGGVHIL